MKSRDPCKEPDESLLCPEVNDRGTNGKGKKEKVCEIMYSERRISFVTCLVVGGHPPGTFLTAPNVVRTIPQ